MNERTKQPAGREAVNAALKQLMSEGVEVNTGEGTEGEEEISLAEKVREAYEGSIEYRLGCQIMDGLTQGYALTSDDAEAMLTGEYAPKSSEIVGARAAETLKRMEKEGRLARGIESYLADGELLHRQAETNCLSERKIPDGFPARAPPGSMIFWWMMLSGGIRHTRAMPSGAGWHTRQ